MKKRFTAGKPRKKQEKVEAANKLASSFYLIGIVFTPQGHCSTDPNDLPDGFTVGSMSVPYVPTTEVIKLLAS